MREYVNGVLGSISVSSLGVTLMHEHIVSANWNMRQCYPEWFDRASFLDYAMRDVRLAMEAGIKTIVDVTPVCLGRDMSIVREVAEKTGIQIIAATGFFHTEQQWMFFRDTKSFLHLLMVDINEGMDGTNIKPGIIKCCTDSLGVTAINEKLLTASAIAAYESGLPITTHASYKNRSGIAQLKILEKYRINPNKIVIGHLGDTNDISYLKEVLSYGCFVGLDRFGDDAKNSIESRVDTLCKLVDMGYADNIMVSHDHVCYVDIGPFEWRDVKHTDPNNNQYNFCTFHKRALPLLIERGMTAKDINQILIDNPRRYFAAE